MVQTWRKVPIFLNLQQVTKGGGSYNLITMLMNSITIVGGLSKADLISNLVSFGADGVLFFRD